ncbi:hypothetical protein [Pararhizobium sp. O133]|uniref:hypothetical protein n=1 Tax=Pararhizobium sp. O133 TaxID=3449278 RepID=UPI003F684A85
MPSLQHRATIFREFKYNTFTDRAFAELNGGSFHFQCNEDNNGHDFSRRHGNGSVVLRPISAMAKGTVWNQHQQVISGAFAPFFALLFCNTIDEVPFPTVLETWMKGKF